MRELQIKTTDPQLINFFEVFRGFNLTQMREAVSFLPIIIKEKEKEEPKVTWITDKQYYYGTITKIGKNHIVLNSKNGNIYKIKVTHEQLQAIKENPLLKNCGILTSFRQRIDTWAQDPKSFEMIEIMEHNPVYDEKSLREKIKKSTPRWQAIGDPDKWLKEIRGYGDYRHQYTL